ncbi:S8 family serine peptidase [Streptomyces phaeochromogenes]|uniref:S8 family serine peptidase n=1 Tax=Streptomyces phaeochromogenes TaxID=1923 RepID=UPI002DDC2B06|nr:S8 family serine peptidase [Streptomyces phaeochromogenes]WRZ34679.1 S8 family serine peptidase [Streptomyces phaeochromogenes]
MTFPDSPLGSGPRSRRTPGRALAVGLALALLGPALVASIPAASAADDPAEITAQVTETLEKKKAADVWLVFDDKADLAKASAIKDWNKRGQAVVDALKATATSSQAETRAELTNAGTEFTSYWISNQIRVPGASKKLVTKLAGLPGVEKITESKPAELVEPEDAKDAAEVNGVEWGLAAINADDVWKERGATGQGITIANIDTGVQYDHPALAAQYRGQQADGTDNHNYNWYDPANVCGSPSVAPCDNQGHGTHTMGTMVGDDGAGNQIGVAPGAKWIAAKGCESDSCTTESLLSSGQWMLAPTDLSGQNPRADLRPDIINNSWGEDNGSDENPYFDDIVKAWTASGIFGLFSNGNAGPNCDTAGSPGDSASAYAVGAFTSGGSIASYSSRGPGADGKVKPDIAAPGSNVRSSVPGNGYASSSGTSMAAPHVAGAVALLWSASPGLIGHYKETIALLDDTAVDVNDATCGGSADDNNVWGEGKLDVLAAVGRAPGAESGVLSGTVTDKATGKPVAGARLDLTGASDRNVVTEEDGGYQLTVTPGEYTVKASLYGYETGTATVPVTDQGTVTQDFELEPKPVWKVAGTVTTDAGKAVAGATVSIPGTPVQPVVTKDDGRYTLPEVAAGIYTLQVATPQGCLGSATVELAVDGDESAEVTLGAKTDAFGDTCVVEKSQYMEADEPFDLTGDDVSAKLDLPFAFPLYNDVYRSGVLSSNGYLSFLPNLSNPFNTAIPDQRTPNAAIYSFWDDVRLLDGVSKIYTKTVGIAPNRQFVIEYRNAGMFGGGDIRFDFETVLHETTGEIVLAYRGLDPDNPYETGHSATVGIENAAGTDALLYSYLGSEPLSDARAIRIIPATGGYIRGTVTDGNDGDAVKRATVAVSAGGRRIATTTTDTKGGYAFRVPTGTGYDVSVNASGYSTQLTTVSVKTDQWTDTDFKLPAGALKVEVGGDLDPWVVKKGSKARIPVKVTNTGTKPLTFEMAELGGAAKTAAAREPGQVISEFEAPGLENISGTAVDGAGNLWLNNFPTRSFVEYDRKKLKPTGRAVDAWYSSDDVDIAYDSKHGLLCQPTGIGPADLIACTDPDKGTTRHIDVSPVGGEVSRGLGYRTDDDTFYLGSATTGKIYQVAGLSHEKPGKLIASCQWTMPVYGVAYHPGTGGLYLIGYGDVYTYDMKTCAQTGKLPDPEAQATVVSGLEVDPSGDLWVSAPNTGKVYRMSSGQAAPTDIGWLSAKTATTTLKAGESATVTVTADTADLKSGAYKAYLEIAGDSGRVQPVTVPVKLVVSAYRQAVDTGARQAFTDTSGRVWGADRQYRLNSYGWVGSSRTISAPASIGILRTEDDGLYRSQREGMDAYRFDGLPAGTYQVTLDFAELRKRAAPGSRAFGVTVNGKSVLSGYDIVEGVGVLTADRRTFLAKAGEGGSITLGFTGPRGTLPPVVAGVAVEHRPDLD